MNSFTLATFNINKDEGEFPERVYSLSETILKYKTDIICFQEDYNSASFSSSQFLNIELDYYCITTPTRNKKRQGVQSSSNLTILSKYKIRLLETVFLKKNKEEERCFQVCEVETESKKILLINTHLCHLSSINRVEHIKLLLQTIRKYSYETIFVCGDFNALPMYNEIKILKESGLKSYNKEFTHQDKVILDYIFYQSSHIQKVKSYVMLQEFSDHYCLVNKFFFTNKESIPCD